MRISTRQTYDALVNNMTNGMAKLLKSQEMFASGKKINKPSDDPVGARQVMDYKDMMSGMTQYQRNIGYAESYLNEAESVLSGVSDTLAKIKEIAINEATGTASAQTRASAAIEVDQLYQQLLGVGNTRIGDKYIFAGFKNNNPAFSINGAPPPAVNYDGDTNEAEIEVGIGRKMAYGLTGDDIFKNTTDIYQVVSDLKTALEGNNATGIQNSMNDLDSGVVQVSNNISKIGGRLNRLTAETENISSFKLETQKLVSNIEDADFAKLVSDFAQQKISLEALQQSTGKVLELNIFNYIR
ncbi:MAG: flagellar hook-associated protein FlgL [Deltaproteobacteria bacterium]|nr:flagellar hook-associated protein FlgL [Deltaproteobacteria bacterium]